ncbi:MAG: TnpV protein [Eubacterium sp.]|nr:TnpV protein [Eubacterium sp.]
MMATEDMIMNEEMTELTYRQEGDYLIPNLTIGGMTEEQVIEKDRKLMSQLRKWGLLRRRYLQEYKHRIFQEYQMEGTFLEHCLEVQKMAEQAEERLIEEMKKKEGVDETLKKTDWMSYVRRLNSIQNRAEEIVKAEYIYTNGQPDESKRWKTRAETEAEIDQDVTMSEELKRMTKAMLQ